MFLVNLTFLVIISTITAQECNLKQFGDGKSICVCNSTYCDSFPDLKPSEITNDFHEFSTTLTKLSVVKTIVDRFERNNATDADIKVTIDKSKRFQKIIGFGGAFTDSFGIVLKSLPAEVQDKLMDSYFSSTGSEYRLCRVPVGGTDFSTRFYSYADNKHDNDKLQNFTLQNEDYNFKIPLIQKAIQLVQKRNEELKLFASAWTAPPWMKTNNEWTGPGFLLSEYFQLWADYYLKFFTAYDEFNVTFWGMTTHNEPTDGFVKLEYNSMGWTFWDMNTWIGNNLGPTIRNSKFKEMKIMLHDDSRALLPFIGVYLNNNLTLNYVDGVAVHWYQDFIAPPSFLNFAYSPKKDLFILKTEACSGTKLIDSDEPIIDLGSWKRAEHYATNIIEDLQYNVSGWVDWNMALDMIGGPSYMDGNDSPILVNATAGEFYKQPMYYVLAHFSKFLIPNSIRVGLDVSGDLDVTAFVRPDNLTVVIIYNRQEKNLNIELEDSSVITQIVVEPKTLKTIIYK